MRQTAVSCPQMSRTNADRTAAVCRTARSGNWLPGFRLQHRRGFDAVIISIPTEVLCRRGKHCAERKMWEKRHQFLSLAPLFKLLFCP
jgi:hypothetical protein